MAGPLEAQRYFEDVKLGDEFDEVQQPTSEHVAEFMTTMRPQDGRAPGAANRFSDANAARRDGLDRPIVPGVMSTAMITRLVTDWMGPLGRIVSLDISFRRPVAHNEPLRCVAVVTEGGDDVVPQPVGSGMVSLDVSLEIAGGEKPVQGTAVVELPRRG